MKKYITIILGTILIPILLWILIPSKTEHTAVETPVEEIVSEPLVGKEHYISFVQEMALKYSISSTSIISIMECENGEYDPTLQSHHKYSEGQIQRNPDWGEVGEREKSFGLVQIHIPAGHTWNGESITREMAEDPYLSIEFLAYHISKGNKNWWSCSQLIK